MKRTNMRYQYDRYEINDTLCGDVLRVVHPTRRIILENRGAQPGANIIVLLRPDQQMQ